MSDTVLIKELARTLRYRELPDLIGKVVRINSLQTIEDDIREALGSALPKECHLLESERWYTRDILSIRGVVNLTFQVPKSLLDADYESGLPLLEKLRFVGNAEAEEMAKEMGIEDDPTSLAELEYNLQRDGAVIRLLLRLQDHPSSARGPVLDWWRDMISRDFTIEDACVTNSSDVWRHRHLL